MYDQQRLRSVCASTHYIKQASWIALSAQTVHTVWSSKGLILGGGGPIYGIVRMCVPNIAPFFSTARYMIGPLFSAKSIWMARFFWFPMWKGPFFLTSWYMHMFFAQRFFVAVYPLGITWIDCDICDICVTTSKKVGTKKNQRIGQHFRWSSIWMGPFFFVFLFVFFKGGYMNRVGFEILARTPVPKLPQSYRPLPHPKVWSECAIAVALLIPLWTVRLSKVNTISECSDQNVQLRRLTGVFACRTRRFVTSRDYRRYIWLAKALIRLLMCRFRVCMLTWLFMQILLLVLPYTHSCA